MVKEMIKNQRKHFRLDSLNLLHIAIYENDILIKQGIGRTLNVSESGIMLETHFPIDQKNNVMVSIGLEEDLVEIKGKVIHATQHNNDKYKIGIKFNKITKSDLEIVKRYITNFTDGKDRKEI